MEASCQWYIHWAVWLRSAGAPTIIFFYFIFWWYWGFNSGPCAWSTTWIAYQPLLPRPPFSYLPLQSSWDDRCVPPHPAFIEMGFQELFCGLALNWDPPDVCLWNNEDYRHEPPGLAFPHYKNLCGNWQIAFRLFTFTPQRLWLTSGFHFQECLWHIFRTSLTSLVLLGLVVVGRQLTKVPGCSSIPTIVWAWVVRRSAELKVHSGWVWWCTPVIQLLWSLLCLLGGYV
jgi:hypothetical protein